MGTGRERTYPVRAGMRNSVSNLAALAPTAALGDAFGVVEKVKAGQYVDPTGRAVIRMGDAHRPMELG